MAVIVALQNIPEGSRVRIYSDSLYVIKIMRGDNSPNVNTDLWNEYNQIHFEKKLDIDPVWIKGHNGNINNERCDRLAKKACEGNELLHDVWYEDKRTSRILPVELVIPNKYKYRNVSSPTRECLINENHVNPKCADSILEFWTYEKPMEDEYGALNEYFALGAPPIHG